jgi:hypothetical protein
VQKVQRQAAALADALVQASVSEENQRLLLSAFQLHGSNKRT